MSTTLRCQGCGYHFGWDHGDAMRPQTCPECGSETLFEGQGTPGRREIIATLVQETERARGQRLVKTAVYERLVKPQREISCTRR